MKPRGWHGPPADAIGRRRGSRWSGRHKVPDHAHPLIRELFTLLNVDGALMTDLGARAGLSRQTVNGWRTKSPQLVTFEAALNVLGYELRIVRRPIVAEKPYRTLRTDPAQQKLPLEAGDD